MNRLDQDSSQTFEFEFSVNQDIQLDLILDQIYPWSEDIYEFVEKEYFKSRWLQILDEGKDDGILHLFFEEENQYLYSLNGDILFRGKWRTLDDSNAFILEKVVNNHVTKSELFDLAFLNEDFFILKKHGNQIKKGKAKYLFLGREDLVEDLDHDEILSKLRKEGYHFPWTKLILAAVLILAIFLLFQYFSSN